MSKRISYADAGGRFGAKPIVLLDRVLGALLRFPESTRCVFHLWFTAEPPNRRLSGRLWCAILVVCVITSFGFLPFLTKATKENETGVALARDASFLR